ncbi:hypothetical protein ACQR3P_28525 [Rhodococcus sp. IEGM1300]
MMWNGVHATTGLEVLPEIGMELANRVVIVSEADAGSAHTPWVMTGVQDVKEAFGSGRLVEMAEASMIPLGAILVKHDHLSDERDRLYESIDRLDATWFLFDGFSLNIEFLDEMAAFVERKQMRGEWVQVVLDTPVPTDQQAREWLMDLASQMNVHTEDGVLESGRQMSMVLRQYGMAGVDFTVEMANTDAGERLHNKEMKGRVEIPLSEDVLRCYADAGIVGFNAGEKATVHAAVNLVQGDSPYRQLSVTRVLQWYLSEWTVALQDIPGESTDIALYATQEVTEALIGRYRESGHFADARYGISFNEYLGEITCDFEMVPFFGVEGITGVGIARIRKG